MERERGGRTGSLVEYGEEKGREYWIVNRIWKGRGEEIRNT